MSTQSVSTQGLHRTARPAPRVVPAARPGYLRMVPQRRPSTPRAPFVVVVLALLAAGLLGLLVLNTALAQDAFRLHTLQKQGAALAGQELTLQRQVEARRAPADLAARAGELGLVQGGPPAFLRLSDGVVLGRPSPAGSPVPAAATPPGAADPSSANPDSTGTPPAGPAVAAPQPPAKAPTGTPKQPTAKKPAARKSPAPHAAPQPLTPRHAPASSR